MAQRDRSLTPSQAAEPVEQSRRSSDRKRRSLLLTITLACLALAAIGAVFAFSRAYDGRIVAHVSVNDVDVSGLRPEQARDVLNQRYAAVLNTPLTLTFAGQTWTPAPEEIGLQVAIDRAVNTAFGMGRGPDALANLIERGTLLRAERNIPLEVSLDEGRLNAYLAARADELAVAARDATLTVANGQVITTPSQMGRVMAVEQVGERVRPGLLALLPQSVELSSQEIAPALDERGVAEAQRRLETLLAQPATVVIGEQSRTWTPEQLGALVQIQRTTGADGAKLEVSLDTTPVAAWLAEVAPSLELLPVEPQLRFSEGAVRISEPGTDGATLDVPAALATITDGLWGGAGQISVALSPVPPNIRPDTLASLGIKELVAEGRSDFSGSAAYRIQNIRAGAAQMDGVLLAPDEEFSFNQHVGAIDASNGFTEGYAIIQGRTQLEWGGGVCQVSTTVFRAAFWAGVPITERNQHSFRIRWYEVYEPIGMDAAIFTGPGGYDFRFVNDTGHWLLMQTEVDVPRKRLTVRLYGTKPNREVIQTDPEITNERPAPAEPQYVADPELPPGAIRQTDTKRGGMDVRVGRIVRQNGQVLYRDTFLSRYKPWPDIFALGPGATPPTPTPAATEMAPSPTGQPEGVPAETAQPVEQTAQPVEPTAQPEPLQPEATPAPGA